MPGHGHAALDYNKTPFLAIWETTQACDLACVHCRAEAQPLALPGELSHEQGLALIESVAAMGTPILVLSGGDPLKRRDLLDLIRHGKKCGLRVGTIPAATDILTRDVVRDLKEAGLDQMAMSLDSPDEEAHDNFRRVPGAYAKTLRGAAWAHEEGLPLQINTVVGKHNFDTFDRMIELVRDLGVVFWEVFFLVTTGRGKAIEDITPQQYEEVFAKLYDLAKDSSFIVKITEGMHFKRYCIQREFRERGIDERVLQGGLHPELIRQMSGPRGSIGRAPSSVNAGKGYVFIAHDGEVYPSGFLPLSGGNVKNTPLEAIYRDSELFRSLRDADRLKGRCGRCGFREVCGGSRARAFATTGDILEEDPCCAYVPEGAAEGDGQRQGARDAGRGNGFSGGSH